MVTHACILLGNSRPALQTTAKIQLYRHHVQNVGTAEEFIDGN